ncbi:MAG: DUF4105 domain-containing protein [Thermoguttaceae bacterium]|jgi:hypothetical protein|nr:DUF4105 domain-containing protein [Thermoguttaceae bacterium]
MNIRRWGAVASWACMWLLLAVAWLWTFAALWLFKPLPAVWAHAAALLWAGATVAVFVRLPTGKALRGVAAGGLLILLIWGRQQPSNDRPWIAAQARLPEITRDGDLAVIRNVRAAVYRSEDDYDVLWRRRTYDLRQLESVDFVMVPFPNSEAMAHVFVTFGFRDGTHLAISPEARREQGAAYSPLRGMFRHYPLMYVIGEESDLIGLRANIQRQRVYVYPIRTSPEQARRLLCSMLDRAASLRESPEYYHTITNACGTNLLWHLNQVRESPVPWGRRVMLPGLSDELAFDLGLIDFEGPVGEARRRFCVEGRTLPWTSGPEWSRQIRATAIGSPP